MSLALTTKRAALAPGRWVRNELWRRARAVPSLDLRFADSKSLIDAVTGQNLVSFTRATSGTYVGSDGVLRTATTNLLLRSEEFDNASWTKSGATVSADQTASPIGLVNADKLVEGTNTGTHNAAQAITVVSGATCVYSTYVKAGERTFAGIYAGTPAQGIIVNLSTGAFVSNLIGAPTAYSIIPAGVGWYRVSLTYTASGATTAPGVYACNNSAAFNYTGDGTSGLFLWGAQLEQSSTVGEYIPTTSTPNSAPRFDHNPTTGESLGLMVEESKANLLKSSQDISTADWTRERGTQSSSSIAKPDGLTSSTPVVWTEDATASATHRIVPSIITGTAVDYAFSVFLKAKERTRARVTTFNGTTERGADVNLSTGTVTAVNAPTSISIVAYPNGWYRVTVVTTLAAAACFGIIYIADNNGNVSYTGDGTSGIYLWGAQLEAGSGPPSSYIPTTTAATTRSADVVTIAGTNFSSWYRQDEGTVFVRGSGTAISGINAAYYDISDGSNGEQIYVRNAGTTPQFVVNDGGSAQVALSGTALSAGQVASLASAYKASDFAITQNGASAIVSTSGTLPTVDRIALGYRTAAGQYFNGHLRRLTYFPTRLPNATLQAITL